MRMFSWQEMPTHIQNLKAFFDLIFLIISLAGGKALRSEQGRGFEDNHWIGIV